MNNTKPLWVLVAVCLLGLWLYTDFDLLPTPYELVLEPEREIRVPGSGTAFSVGEGLWMTARHVVDKCDGIGFIKNERLVGVADRVVHHDTADASLLYADFSALPLPIARPNMDPQRHDDAFLIGYPAGSPREFIAKQVEYREIERSGVPGGAFPVIVWAERPEPPAGTDYAGMSGGPVINGEGYVIGILVGSDDALGRIVANTPTTLRSMLPGGGSSGGAQPVSSPTAGDLSEIGRRLRAENRVIQVYCHVE
ncbi:serine protease [Hwanghaeella grinnelliae]|uniref:Serine protease n=1 Tax=Hwanghaeella grinnelliae TaxID=2500179 RepID=A0A3S2VMU6_9PROT|nr:serine protease [Hwanghaeella grinnelliae]RVU36654.1 serine protease [Hwanghaeella grinnelliae]